MPSTVATSYHLSERQQAFWLALQEKRFFKLIGGGSLTETPVLEALTWLYGEAGADCIDVAPDADVLAAVARGLDRLASDKPRPLVMASIPLDADPHFRKIELIAEDCIECGACIPICPTEAIAIGEPLEITQSLCYGCGRCPAVCPTDALVLHPFQVEAQIDAVLANPLVEAIELHTGYADPLMLTEFLARYGSGLQNKLVAVCFRPDQIESSQWLGFLRQLRNALPLPILVQIDGQPMSGSDDPAASLPSLSAAVGAAPLLEDDMPVTISGGINRQTADYLRDSAYGFVAGVGMGTVARRAVWAALQPEASSVDRTLGLETARKMVQAFQKRGETIKSSKKPL